MLAVQGHSYVGGVDVPFFVPNSSLAEDLLGLGFVDVRVVNRKGFPARDLPPIPAGASDDWNTVALATRAGPTMEMELPERLKWIVDVTPVAPVDAPPVPSSPPVAPFPSSPPSAHAPDPPSIGGSVVLGLAFGLVGGVLALAWASR